MRRFALVVLLLAAVAAPARASTVGVEVRDFSFSPSAAVAANGDQITWSFTGSARHTVTAYAGASFDSGQLTRGASFSQNMGSATILYRCTLHSSLDAASNCNGMCGRVALPPSAAAPTIDEPMDGARLNAVPVTVSGRVDASAAFVRLDDAGTPLVTVIQSRGTWSTEISPADGSHTLVAVALAPDGARLGSSVPVRLLLDTQAPAVVLTSPSDLTVTGTPVTVTGTAKDNLAVSTVRVEASLSAAVITQTTSRPATCTGCGTASVSWTASLDLLPGVYMVRAIASDAVGNTTATAPVRVVVL